MLIELACRIGNLIPTESHRTAPNIKLASSIWRLTLDMSVWGSIAAVIATPLVLAAAWSGAKYAPTLFFPTKPQLFKFKRTSAHNSGNGAAVDSKDGPVSTSIGGVIANGVDDALKTELLSVQTLLETRVPSLFSGYAPSWWLPSGHMLTGYVVAGDFTKVDQVVYERCVSFTFKLDILLIMRLEH